MQELKRVSNRKLEAIEEALTEWKKTKNKNTAKDRSRFQVRMEKRGWCYIGYGAYKICLAKGSIIVKYAKNPGNSESVGEVDREYEQWLATPYHFKQYLTRTYDLVNGLLIQDKVLKECGRWNCKKLRAVEKIYRNLNDCGQNHGHSQKGKLKFFDWVYNRRWDLVRAPHRKLIEK